MSSRPFTLKANTAKEEEAVGIGLVKGFENEKRKVHFYRLTTEDFPEDTTERIPIAKEVTIEVLSTVPVLAPVSSDSGSGSTQGQGQVQSLAQTSISIALPKALAENVIHIFNGDIPLEKLDCFLFVSAMLCDYSKADPTQSDILTKDGPSKDDSDLDLFHPVRFYNGEDEVHQAIYIGHGFFIDKMGSFRLFTLRTRAQIVEQYDVDKIFGCETKKRCDNCKKSGPDLVLYRCNGCQVAKYCGRDCQKKAWPVHKTSCKTFKRSFGNHVEQTMQRVSKRANLYSKSE